MANPFTPGQVRVHVQDGNQYVELIVTKKALNRISDDQLGKVLRLAIKKVKSAGAA